MEVVEVSWAVKEALQPRVRRWVAVLSLSLFLLAVREEREGALVVLRKSAKEETIAAYGVPSAKDVVRLEI